MYSIHAHCTTHACPMHTLCLLTTCTFCCFLSDQCILPFIVWTFWSSSTLINAPCMLYLGPDLGQALWLLDFCSVKYNCNEAGFAKVSITLWKWIQLDILCSLQNKEFYHLYRLQVDKSALCFDLRIFAYIFL